MFCENVVILNVCTMFFGTLNYDDTGLSILLRW